MASNPPPPLQRCHNTFLIEVKHELYEIWVRETTPKESQHLLNRGQTPRNRAAVERPPKSQHLLNRGQTFGERLSGDRPRSRVTTPFPLNRGQTLRSLPIYSGDGDSVSCHNTFLIEVKPTTTSGVKPPMACHNTFLIEVKHWRWETTSCSLLRHNTFSS